MILAETNFPEAKFDVAVIGAGINGAGIARDAAMRRLKVLLVDKGDIAAGTSSWSTRLIHGGLRYLEHGEIGLVRESLRERSTLMKIAPHLVRPLPLLIPVYKNARRGRWTMRAGLLVYDLLSGDGGLPRHRTLSRDAALREEPALASEGLLGAAIYYDAQVEFAERLVVENVLSAIQHGASVLTYTRVAKVIAAGGETRLQLASEYEGREKTVHAGVIVNATGPWVDHLLAESPGQSRRLIGGTKGSHIVVAPFQGAPRTAIYVEAQTDRRPFFIIPWNNNYLIGTTDSRFDQDPENARIDDDETNYLLNETNRVIPSARLDGNSVLYSYSGVRPLPFTDDQDAQSITRRHFIRQHPDVANLISIVGGKLTTYRSLAEQTVDLIFKKLGRISPECATAREPLSEDDASDSEFSLQEGDALPQRISERLRRIYGDRARAVLRLIQEQPALAEVFDEETGAVAAEVVHAFRHELAQTLADCLLRRTMVGLNSTCGLKAIESAAKVAQEHLGWSQTKARLEVDAYRKYVERFSPRHLFGSQNN